MAKRKKDIDDPNQLSIFDYINNQKAAELVAAPKAGSLQIDIEMREVVSDILKGCPLSRYQVVAKMSELTGEDITKSMLDTWTAESKENHRFPAKYVPAFSMATNNSQLLVYLCRKAGLFVMPDTEALRAEIRHLEEDIEKKKREKKKRVVLLQEVEGRDGR